MELIPILEKSFLEIANLMRNQNTLDLGDYMNEYNFSGDDVKQLDLMSNVILKTNLEKCNKVRCIGSEEDEELHYTKHEDAPYLICFDPLDGSTNIDVNITTGTIFAIYKYDHNNEIKNGRNIIMSGYSLYGASTQYLIAYNNKLSMYQYVPSENMFVCNKTDMKIKETFDSDMKIKIHRLKSDKRMSYQFRYYFIVYIFLIIASLYFYQTT